MFWGGKFRPGPQFSVKIGKFPEFPDFSLNSMKSLCFLEIPRFPRNPPSNTPGGNVALAAGIIRMTRGSLSRTGGRGLPGAVFRLNRGISGISRFLLNSTKILMFFEKFRDFREIHPPKTPIIPGAAATFPPRGRSGAEFNEI